jgi:hypothetical protein
VFTNPGRDGQMKLEQAVILIHKEGRGGAVDLKQIITHLYPINDLSGQ